jgi:hypothetical protein
MKETVSKDMKRDGNRGYIGLGHKIYVVTSLRGKGKASEGGKGKGD